MVCVPPCRSGGGACSCAPCSLRVGIPPRREARDKRGARRALRFCFVYSVLSIVGIPIPTVSSVSAVGLRLGWHMFLRMRVACALACTLVAVSAHDGQRRWISSNSPMPCVAPSTRSQSRTFAGWPQHRSTSSSARIRCDPTRTSGSGPPITTSRTARRLGAFAFTRSAAAPTTR